MIPAGIDRKVQNLEALDARLYQLAVDHMSGIQTIPVMVAQYQPAGDEARLDERPTQVAPGELDAQRDAVLALWEAVFGAPRAPGKALQLAASDALAMDDAARSLLAGPDKAEPFAPVPYFWSDQYKTKIQFVGHVQRQRDDELAVLHFERHLVPFDAADR